METVNVDQRMQSLRQAWEEVQKTKPGIRIRDAARSLDVSEAELLATMTGENCVRLKEDWQDLVKRLPELGYVMSLTRNEDCILENKGPFQKVSTFGKGSHAMGTVVGPIETRIFFDHWKFAFAVQQKKNDRELKSIQVFDKAGDAITKIYLQEKSNESAYYKLIEDFTLGDQSPNLRVVPYPEETFTSPADVESLLADWSKMESTHDFFPMLRKHKAHRYDAVELAEGKYTRQVSLNVVEEILQTASMTKLPIMIFAGNRGNIQIFQGKVRTIRSLERGGEQWLNVLDPAFNMHLRMDKVKTAWIVEKPTSEGPVTAVELFGDDKTLIAQFFGLRNLGIPQRKEWSDLMAGIETL